MSSIIMWFRNSRPDNKGGVPKKEMLKDGQTGTAGPFHEVMGNDLRNRICEKITRTRMSKIIN